VRYAEAEAACVALERCEKQKMLVKRFTVQNAFQNLFQKKDEIMLNRSATKKRATLETLAFWRTEKGRVEVMSKPHKSQSSAHSVILSLLFIRSWVFLERQKRGAIESSRYDGRRGRKRNSRRRSDEPFVRVVCV
jgi:hypothetical protein